MDLGLPLDDLRRELSKLELRGLHPRVEACPPLGPARHQGGRGDRAWPRGATWSWSRSRPRPRPPRPRASGHPRDRHPRRAEPTRGRGQGAGDRALSAPGRGGSGGARRAPGGRPLPRGRRRRLDRGRRGRGDRPPLAARRPLRVIAPERRDRHRHHVPRHLSGAAAGHGPARPGRAGLRGGRGRAPHPHGRAARDRRSLRLTGRCPCCGPRPSATGRAPATSRAGPTCFVLIVGETVGAQARGGSGEAILVLETEVDDTSPQLLGSLLDRLLAAGAQDAYFTSIHMKKGRPGILITVLCEPARRETLEEIALPRDHDPGRPPPGVADGASSTATSSRWRRPTATCGSRSAGAAASVYNVAARVRGLRARGRRERRPRQGGLGRGPEPPIASRELHDRTRAPLPHHPDLLRQRRAPRGARLHHDRGRRLDPRAPARAATMPFSSPAPTSTARTSSASPGRRASPSSSTATRSRGDSGSSGRASTSSTTTSSAPPTTSTSAACSGSGSPCVEAKTPDGQAAVYRGKYAGWYCPRCEGFKDEDELKQPGNICPDHERPCEWTEEENFFFRLSAYADWLREEIESDRIRIDPVGRQNEVLAVIRGGLQDFCVSRARVKWGIPIPEQPDHVLYVWVDALSNYITALGFADDDARYRKYWGGRRGAVPPHRQGDHPLPLPLLAGPAARGRRPRPTRFFAQGWITKNGKKLSKTTGNVIDPGSSSPDYGPDAVRYFLLREGSTARTGTSPTRPSSRASTPTSPTTSGTWCRGR